MTETYTKQQVLDFLMWLTAKDSPYDLLIDEDLTAEEVFDTWKKETKQ